MFGWKTKTAAPLRAFEMTGAYGGTSANAAHGVVKGTMVATSKGWRAVEELVPGDLILTFDHGLQIVTDIRVTKRFSDAVKTPEAAQSVRIPAGVLGNKDDVTLLPEQGVMVESDAARDIYGDPLAIVPASCLVGYKGIRRDQTSGECDVLTLFFDSPEIIHVAGGTLVYCPPAVLTMSDMVNPQAQPYELLNEGEADLLVGCMAFGTKPARAEPPAAHARAA